jgi:HKD family nuclease
MTIEFISHPADEFRLGDFLNKAFADPQWTDFRAAVAFVKRSGTKHIYAALSSFVERGGRAILTAGVDVGGTTAEALEDLLQAVNDKGEVFVFHNANSSTFHPKIYLFRNEKKAVIIVGSANLTEGGLFTNYEACLQITLDDDNETDWEILTQIEKNLIEWSSAQDGLCFKVTPKLIKQLTTENQLPVEAKVRAERIAEVAAKQQATIESIFSAHKIRKAPKAQIIEPEIQPSSQEEDQAVLADAEEAETLDVEVPQPTAAQEGIYSLFLMTLQKTDVGVGQTTTGTQRRSPEIFIPLVCRDYDPDFWGWPNSFVSDVNWRGPVDQNGRGKMDRTNVMVRLGGETFPVSIWYNPDKRDVRIRSEHIRRAGAIGDILYLERADGSAGYSDYAEIIPQGSIRFPEYIDICTKGVRNSKKLWNYL